MNRKSKTVWAGLVVLVACAAVSLAADRDGWRMLGSRKVTDRVDRDVIPVGAREGEFSAVQLRVQGVAVQFRSMTIHFVNGKRQEVELRDVIPAGGQSRVVDLVGDDRHIRSVEFLYDSQSLGRRGTVRLWGRR